MKGLEKGAAQMSHLASRIASGRCLIGLLCCVGGKVPVGASECTGQVSRDCGGRETLPVAKLAQVDPHFTQPGQPGVSLYLGPLRAPCMAPSSSDQECPCCFLCRVERADLFADPFLLCPGIHPFSSISWHTSSAWIPY